MTKPITFSFEEEMKEIKERQKGLHEKKLKAIEEAKKKVITIIYQKPDEERKTVTGVLGNSWIEWIKEPCREMGLDKVITVRKPGTKLAKASISVRHILSIKIKGKWRRK